MNTLKKFFFGCSVQGMSNEINCLYTPASFNTNRIRVVYDKVYEVYKKIASATHPLIMNNKNNDKAEETPRMSRPQQQLTKSFEYP